METISLKQSHINEAVSLRDSIHKLYICKSCPIAIALTEHFNRKCWVGTDNWGWLDENKTFSLPKEARDIVINFDSGKFEKLKPVEFQVEMRD